MWPERFGRRPRRNPVTGSEQRHDVITNLDGTVEDPELVGLAEELSRAGVVARHVAGEVAGGPSPAFAAELRTRLLGGFPVGSTGRLEPRVAKPQAVRRILPAPRWTALAAAAVLLLSVIGLKAGLVRPPAVTSHAAVASGATLIRDGQQTALAAGNALHVGDEVRVDAGGNTTIALGSSEARLAGGADLRIDLVSADRIVVAQIAGRVYHRVVAESGMTYTVETATIDWVARGTAFDLDRESANDGARLTLTTIQHAVQVSGPGLKATVDEGHQALATVGSGDPEISIGDVPEGALHDPWLVANARIDAALGYPLGILDEIDLTASMPSMAPTLTPTATPSIGLSGPTPSADASPEAVGPTASEPPATPRPTATPATARPTPEPTPGPTAKPTPKPTPDPTAKPTSDLESMSLTATACSGGVVLDWGAFGGGGFDHYLVLRSTSATIPAAYPPHAGTWAVAGTYTTKRTKTDGVDRTERGGATAHYRAIAFGADDQALAASTVRTVKTTPVKRLGGLTVDSAGSSTTFNWSPFTGSATCYTSYKLVYSADDSTPSYLGGDAIAWGGTKQSVDSGSAVGLSPGTYWFRLQALRATSLGTFVVAQTSVVRHTVP